jgi:hypothetical protein
VAAQLEVADPSLYAPPRILVSRLQIQYLPLTLPLLARDVSRKLGRDQHARNFGLVFALSNGTRAG